METSAIYQVSWLLGVPALAVRGASNSLNHQGTDDKISECDIEGSMEAATEVLIKILNRLIYLSQLQQTHSEKQDSSEHARTEQETKEIMKHFKLQPHPEGGHYARTFTSAHFVTSLDKNRYNNEQRHAGSSIYYLLKGNDFSAWHRLKSDEIWHHYKGSSIKVYVINAEGILTTHLLGDPTVYAGAVFQVAIPADHWFAAEITHKASYSLIGCTVSPGFEFVDWKIADNAALIKKFPQHEVIINRFTLPDSEDACAHKITSRL